MTDTDASPRCNSVRQEMPDESSDDLEMLSNLSDQEYSQPSKSGRGRKKQSLRKYIHEGDDELKRWKEQLHDLDAIERENAPERKELRQAIKSLKARVAATKEPQAKEDLKLTLSEVKEQLKEMEPAKKLKKVILAK